MLTTCAGCRHWESAPNCYRLPGTCLMGHGMTPRDRGQCQDFHAARSPVRECPLIEVIGLGVTGGALCTATNIRRCLRMHAALGPLLRQLAAAGRT